MSVLSYLTSRASDTLMDVQEKDSIKKSIATLKARLNTNFEGRLKDHFQFGSSTRGTILPRSMNEHSDIDYLIVFNDDDSVPQTYLTLSQLELHSGTISRYPMEMGGGEGQTRMILTTN